MIIFLAYTTKYTRYININLYSKIYFFSTIFSCLIFYISTSYIVCTGMSDCIQMSNVYILNKYIISTQEMNSINHAVICWLPKNIDSKWIKIPWYSVLDSACVTLIIKGWGRIQTNKQSCIFRGQRHPKSSQLTSGLWPTYKTMHTVIYRQQQRKIITLA